MARFRSRVDQITTHECEAQADGSGSHRRRIHLTVVSAEGSNAVPVTVAKGDGLVDEGVRSAFAQLGFKQIHGQLGFRKTTFKSDVEGLRADIASLVDVIYEEHQQVATPRSASTSHHQ